MPRSGSVLSSVSLNVNRVNAVPTPLEDRRTATGARAADASEVAGEKLAKLDDGDHLGALALRCSLLPAARAELRQ